MNQMNKVEHRALFFSTVYILSYGILRQFLFLPWLECDEESVRQYSFILTVVFTALYSMPFYMILEGAHFCQWRNIMKNKPLSWFLVLCYCSAFVFLMSKVFEYGYFDSVIEACCIIFAACVIFISNLWALIQFYFGKK